jgi:hypothetical protein
VACGDRIVHLEFQMDIDSSKQVIQEGQKKMDMLIFQAAFISLISKNLSQYGEWMMDDG